MLSNTSFREPIREIDKAEYYTVNNNEMSNVENEVYGFRTDFIISYSNASTEVQFLVTDIEAQRRRKFYIDINNALEGE